MVIAQAENNFADLEQELAGDNAFAPEEMFNLLEIASITTGSMPEDTMTARQVDFTSESHKASFPQGIPCLILGLKGLDVHFAFAEDGVKTIYIPMVNFNGPNIGKRKGEGSQVHIISEAFDAVFGIKPLGEANRAALLGRKARWGQHIDSFTPKGQRKVAWKWDVPRTALPDDFVYEGEIRTVGGGGTTAEGVGVVELTSEEAMARVLDVVIGENVNDNEAICDKVLDISGLPNDTVNAAIDRTLLRLLKDEDYIDAGPDGVITAGSN